jgi:hypothetical protein
MSPLAILLLGLALFGIKHFLADFVLQFPYMIREKGIYGADGGIHHAAVHASFTFLILVLLANNVNDIILLSLLDGILHYHIDWAKQQFNKGLTPADRMFWVWLGLDQALHYLTYIGILCLLVLK